MGLDNFSAGEFGQQVWMKGLDNGVSSQQSV
jgi:hypothetical protein